MGMERNMGGIVRFADCTQKNTIMEPPTQELNKSTLETPSISSLPQANFPHTASFGLLRNEMHHTMWRSWRLQYIRNNNSRSQPFMLGYEQISKYGALGGILWSIMKMERGKPIFMHKTVCWELLGIPESERNSSCKGRTVLDKWQKNTHPQEASLEKKQSDILDQHLWNID